MLFFLSLKIKKEDLVTWIHVHVYLHEKKTVVGIIGLYHSKDYMNIK